ncbi:MAG: response regulator [Myxococcota bacterium]
MTKTILAVDDSRTIRTAVSYTFGTTDFEVLAVDSGPDAVAQIGRGGVSLVLLDVGLPEQDGYEVAKSLRAQAPHVPVLLLTSSFHPWDEGRGSAAGVAGHIAKPFDTQSLLDLVERTMAEAAQSGSRLSAVPDLPDEGEVWSFSDDVEEIEDIDIEDVPELDAADALPSIEFDSAAPEPGPPPAPPPRSREVSLDLSSFEEPQPAPEFLEPAPELVESAPNLSLPVEPPALASEPPPRMPSPAPPPRPPSLEASPPPRPPSLEAATHEVARRAASSPVLAGSSEDEVRAMAREVVERIAWEVVPELAEAIIREELARLTKE